MIHYRNLFESSDKCGVLSAIDMNNDFFSIDNVQYSMFQTLFRLSLFLKYNKTYKSNFILFY